MSVFASTMVHGRPLASRRSTQSEDTTTGDPVPVLLLIQHLQQFIERLWKRRLQ
jgi:hypothetical protein